MSDLIRAIDGKIITDMWRIEVKRDNKKISII